MVVFANGNGSGGGGGGDVSVAVVVVPVVAAAAAVVGVAVLGDVVVVVAVVVVIVDSTGVVFLLLCSRTRYANTWFAYLDSLAFYVFLCLTVCDHRICNSLG